MAGGDIVLITIDTLRADAPGFAGNAEAATPNLDRLAREGRVFRRAYAHNVVTLPSHTNILTGLYPHQHGVRENSGFKLAPDIPTLATVLKAQGYATAAFVAAFPLDARYGLHRGFDVYDDRYSEGSHADQFIAAERRGDEVLALAVDWWRSATGQRRFLWVHVYDPHAPYTPPEPFASRFPRNPYRGEVAATDAYLAELLELLAAEPQRPLVVVTSDHGEALGEHGEASHGLFAYEATLKVPLVVWGPGVEPGVDERLAGHVDILPTILAAVGVATDGETSGSSLLAEAIERPLYFESLTTFFNRDWAPLRGFIAGPYKMIELPLPELYDLSSDPRETSNVVRDERRRFQDLRAAFPTEPWPPGERQEASAEEREKLRSLGYLSESKSRRAHFTTADDPKNLVDVDRKIHDTIDAYSRGLYERAAALAKELVEARPDMATGYHYLALVLRQMERPDEAITTLRAAMSRGLSEASLLRQLGLTYAENHFAREAIEVLEPFASGEDPETLNALGIAYSDAGRHVDGLKVLNRALRFDPSAPKTLETLGVVTLRLQRPREAQRYLEEALAINDELPFSWNTLGVAHAYQGNHVAAVEAWERAIQIDSRQYDALYNLGMTASRIGRREVARRALQRYVETAPPERFAADIAKARQVLRGL
jgi:arylsulfatase A-like enzyme/Flp pilus assembly protein TadD